MRTTSGIALMWIALAAASVGCSTTEHIITNDPANGGSQDGTDPSIGSSDPGATDPSKDPTNPDAPRAPLATGIAIKDVAFFQGTKVLVVKDGASSKSRAADIAVGRPALVRVYVKPDDSSPRVVTAELRIESGDKKFPVVRETKTIAKASTDEDTKSTFNLEVPAESITADATFQVALTATDGENVDGDSPARFPQNGEQADLGAKATGRVKVVIVPIKYDADGSSRTPDIGEDQLKLYKDTMMARYPVTGVDITVRAPLSWPNTISASGSGFSQILSSITRLRSTDGAAKDVYYYGAFAPAATFNNYCGQGCVTGLSTVVTSAQTSSMRASVGVGFSGYEAANTMAHEIGHAHGRDHAPCGGAAGADARFPYKDGSIGNWGYDIVAKKLYAPTKSFDMMGYCPNEWVSDYTYAALFQRVIDVTKLVGGSSSGGGQNVMNAANVANVASVRLAVADANGDLSWSTDTFESDALSGGEPRTVTFQDATGAALGTGGARFYAYDHIPGGVVVVPSDVAATATWSHVKVQGFARALAK